MKRWLIPSTALIALAFASAKAYDWRWQREETTPLGALRRQPLPTLWLRLGWWSQALRTSP